MEERAPLSVAAGASGVVALVSPPPMDVKEASSLPDNAELVAAAPAAPVQASQATSSVSLQSTTDTTPGGSPARLTAASVAQHGHKEPSSSRDPPTTPETASSERSASDGEPTPTESEKGGAETQNNGNRDQNAASTAATGSGNEAAGQQEEQGDSAAGQGEEQVGSTTGQTTGTGQESSSASAATDLQAVAAKKKAKIWFDVLPMVLHNFKTHNREQIKQLMLPRCVLCERGKVDQKAEAQCKQEGCILSDRPLCSLCWKSTHSSEGARKHRRLSASICQQCQLERTAYWCAECDLKFCRECFEQIHSVPVTKNHRKLATEDAPGTCLAKSHWSRNFQNVILQMVAARKHPPNGTTGGGSINGKRKRDIEVIVIDDDDDDENEATINNVQADSSLGNGTSEQQVTVNHQNGSSTGTEDTRPSEVYIQPQQAASANIYFQAPVTQNSTIQPIPFPQEFTETAFSMLNGANTVNINTNVGSLQWNNSAPQFGASSSMGNGSSSTAFATSVMSNGMMEVTPSSMPTTVNTSSGVWSTTSAISTDLASTSNPINLLPLGGAVFAENALVDSLVDRYHEVNQNVANMELQSEHLTRQIAVATCHGPYNAGPIMALLSKLQPVLEAARRRRDKLLIAMIIQSNDIMASVRLLRLTELGDVPQVPMISHRKCLQLSNEINQHKTELIELNQQLSETLTQSNEVNSSWENTLIRTTSANIQMHEKSIKKLKKDREVEFVRIVQFSCHLREALKHAFQRSVEVQRQQQQQQQRQQFQPYG